MISIIIRTYNEEKYLRELLSAIAIQSYKDFEVILVDSGSTDGTLGIASGYNFVKVINIKKEDFTFGYSLNVGAAEASGEIILNISGHCIPINEHWLFYISEGFNDVKVGIVYGRQIGFHTSKFSEHQIFHTWYPDKNINKQTNSFCNNANCAVRKTILDKLGGYDEKATGLEDVLFAEKMLSETKYYLSYSANAVIYHIHDETWGQIKNRYFREAITYSNIHKSEKFTFLDLIKLTLINVTHDIKQLYSRDNNIHVDDKFKTIWSIILFRLNQFYGTYKGFKYARKNNTLRNKFYYPK